MPDVKLPNGKNLEGTIRLGKAPRVADGLSDAVELLMRRSSTPTLIPHDVVFVSVCSFTFRFDSKEHLARVLDYYEHKIVPSSREPESTWGMRGGDHGEADRWFERLPQFLREEPKRQKVVKELRNALKALQNGQL